MIRSANVSKKINPDIKERNSMEFQKLKEIIVDVLGCNEEDITADTTFVDD